MCNLILLSPSAKYVTSPPSYHVPFEPHRHPDLGATAASAPLIATLPGAGSHHQLVRPPCALSPSLLYCIHFIFLSGTKEVTEIAVSAQQVLFETVSRCE